MESAHQLADGFHALGLKAGDVMVFQIPHWAESLAAFIAALKLGIILVPVVHIYGPSELAYILRASKARALMMPDQWRHIDYAARVEALGNLPDLGTSLSSVMARCRGLWSGGRDFWTRR